MSLNYTTGNPANLTGGATASMNDIQGPFTDIRTFLTDGSAAIGDTMLTSPTNAVWRTVFQLDFRAGITSLSTTPCYVGGTAIVASGSPGSAISGLWSPATSADVAVVSKTTRLRIRAAWGINATGPGITITWGLYPITTLAGGINNITPTLGTVIAGSTAAVASPTAGQAGVALGTSFDFSTLSFGTDYVIGVVGSGAQAANSLVGCTAYLEMRHT